MPSPKSKKTPARTCLVILGMHRSGTSALGGLLNLLGCDMPRRAIGGEGANPKGYFESAPLNKLNNEILASAGSAWDDWLPFNPEWEHSPTAVGFRRRADEILAGEYDESSFFFFKDPRNCRLFGFWRARLEAAGCRPLIISTLRNPWEVAQSLHSRDGLPVEYGLLLWLRHVLDAEAAGRDLPRFHTSYEQVLTNWSGLATRAAEELGIAWPRALASVAGDIEAFLEVGLRHFSADEARWQSNPLVSDWVREAYEILSRWVQQGEDKADHVRLDRLRATLDAAGPAFAQLARAGAGAQSRQEMEQMVAQREEILGRETVLTRELAETLEANQVQEAELSRLGAQLAQVESTLRQRSLEAEQADGRIRELRQGQAEQVLNLETRIGGLTADVERQVGERRFAEEAMQAARRRLLTVEEETIRESVTLKARMAQQRETLAAVQGRAGEQERLLADRALRITDLEAQDAALAERLEKTVVDLINHQQEVGELRSSTSWKITGPLRRIARVLRKRE